MFFRKKSLSKSELAYIQMPLCSCTSCEKQKEILRSQITKKRLFHVEILRIEYNEEKQKVEARDYVS